MARAGRRRLRGCRGLLDRNFGGSVASPMVWMVAAAARRELGDADADVVDTATGGQTTGETFAATTAAAEVGNQPPVIISATAGAPSTSTGVATGTVTATDANNDILKYTATATKGTVSISPTAGAFTYTPTAAARHTAAADTATTDKQDTVTVTVTDGHGGVAAQTVTVAIAPKNSAPTIGSYGVTVATPNTTTGVVTGKITATDANKDPLTYTAPTTTSKGARQHHHHHRGVHLHPHRRGPPRRRRHRRTDIGQDRHLHRHRHRRPRRHHHQNRHRDHLPQKQCPHRGRHTDSQRPQPDTGIVTGTLGAADADADALSYKATPTKGTITFNAGGSVHLHPHRRRTPCRSSARRGQDRHVHRDGVRWPRRHRDQVAQHAGDPGQHRPGDHQRQCGCPQHVRGGRPARSPPPTPTTTSSNTPRRPPRARSPSVRPPGRSPTPPPPQPGIQPPRTPPPPPTNRTP